MLITNSVLQDEPQLLFNPEHTMLAQRKATPDVVERVLANW
jgi:hypothetical protein